MTTQERRTVGAGFAVVDRFDDAATIVDVRGEIDVASAPDLAEHLGDVLLVRPAAVIVDLNECDFLDATAIGVLVDAYVTAREGGVAFSVVGATGIVLRALDLTGVARILCPDENDPRSGSPQGSGDRTTSSSASGAADDDRLVRRLRPC